MKRWVVREAATLAVVLAKMGEDASAVADGRVFIGKKRATSASSSLRAGDEVHVGPVAQLIDPEILFERDGLVACVKPAGIPTVPDHAGASQSLVGEVARVLRQPLAALRVTSRLDREVSGVVLFALDAAAEARLKEARAAGAYARRYVALAKAQATTGAIAADPDAGRWDAPIGKGRDPRHRRVGGGEAQAAATRYRAVATSSVAVLLAVDPETGRTHQIRVHASHAGLPLLGDRDYGGPTRLTLPGGKSLALGRIALHCARVAVAGVEATAPIPAELGAWWSALGGGPEAWNTAMACDVPG